jgi:hypothetical protein
MTGRFNLLELRYRVKGPIWFSALSFIHGVFDSTVRKKAPLEDFQVLVLCVYRHKNGAIVLRSLSEAIGRGWEIRLWALDRIHPDLEQFSHGAGAGARSPLLNSLLGTTDPGNFDWIIVMDDDFEFQLGSMSWFLASAHAAGLSLAQPARGFGRYKTFRLISCDPLSIARLTSFVEIGPILAVNGAWAPKILPFPEDFAMGWGLDILWSDLRREGLRLGVIDWVTINHLSPVGRTYDRSPEKQRLEKMLRERGFSCIEELQKTLGVWRPWEPRAPWLREGIESRG